MANDLLPREVVETILDQIDLLRAMYVEGEELLIDDHEDKILSEMRAWSDALSTQRPHMPPFVSLTLILRVAEEREKPKVISLSIDASFTQTSDVEASALKVRVRQPDWLTKTEATQLAAGMPQDDVLSAIEHVREQAGVFLASSKQPKISSANDPEQNLVRVWFYFPSISAREKRNDIVKYAPSYGLTGFLLAGKPGVLCLEGGAQDIDDYMKFIKTESWGDIPSQHKKVSERHRETGWDLRRMFPDMQEITDQLEKRGERSNRSDMKALEAWLGEKGLGEAFSTVLM